MNKTRTKKNTNKKQQQDRHIRLKRELSKKELARLIPLAIKGDQIALKAIITAYKGIVGSKLRGKLLQDANEADIKELTNRVFYNMIRNLPNLKSKSCFKAWLMKIAERVAYSHLRAFARQRKHLNAVIAHQLSQVERDNCDRAHKHPLLRQIFKSIPKQYRQVLWDAIVNDLSHKEIAQKHNWGSPEVARQKLYQAMRAIAKLPLPVITVEIDEEGRMKAFKWNRTPLDPGSPFASL